LNNAGECVSGMSSGESCDECIKSVFEGLQSNFSCATYEDQMCSGFDTCGCTTCQYQLELAYSCVVQDDCDPLDCENSFSPAPTSACSAAFDEFDLCDTSLSSGFSCAECIGNLYNELPDNPTCLSYEDQMCSGIATCGCTECQEELKAAYGCLVQDACDPLDCENLPTATPSFECSVQWDTTVQCVSGTSLGESCLACINEIHQGFEGNPTTCSLYEDQMCSGFDSCGCTACKAELANYFSCFLLGSCDPIECASTETPCSYSFTLVRDCINTTSKSACIDCLNNAQDAMNQGKETINCLEYSDGMCPAISTECDCGTCRQVIEDVSSSLLNCFHPFTVFSPVLRYLWALTCAVLQVCEFTISERSFQVNP
jgi:hypothetical protein